MIRAAPLTATAFASYGEVIETTGGFTLINAGLCQRFNDLATLACDAEGRIGVSLFDAKVRALPYTCDLMERHPLASQCFLPMGHSTYLVIVAPDDGGVPGVAEVFTASATQGINIKPNTWHGVLAPLSGSGLFAVVDRVAGDGVNLEEHVLAEPLVISEA